MAPPVSDHEPEPAEAPGNDNGWSEAEEAELRAVLPDEEPVELVLDAARTILWNHPASAWRSQ